MPLQLMKIRVEATSSVETGPNLQKFFYVTTIDIAAGTTLTIEVDQFFDDLGAQATELPALEGNNSWYNVYVNGVLQMQELTRYTPGTSGTGQLEIDVPAGGEDILDQTPVVLEVVNFTPNSTITVET